MAFRGVVGLLGGAEMFAPCRPFDEALIAACGNPSEVRIVSAAVVRNGSVPRAMAQAEGYFGGIGCAVIDIGLHRRGDASRRAVVDVLEGAGLTYLLGGDPGYLLDCLLDTPAWAALQRSLLAGGGVAGSSAGAMVLASALLLRSPNPAPKARHAREALGLVSGVVVPHLRKFAPGWIEAARRESQGADILGLDESTGIVYSGAWTVHGPGAVRLWPQGADPPREYAEGDRVPMKMPVIAA